MRNRNQCLFSVFSLAMLFMVSSLSHAQDKKVTLKFDRQPTEELFKGIQLQSGYNIVYSDEIISDTIMSILTTGLLQAAQTVRVTEVRRWKMNREG